MDLIRNDVIMRKMAAIVGGLLSEFISRSLGNISVSSLWIENDKGGMLVSPVLQSKLVEPKKQP